MADDEQQIATSIEINTVNKTDADENKESNGHTDVPLDNDKPVIKRDNTVFGGTMDLKRAFDDDMQVYEPTNWKLMAYWLHLWITYACFWYTAETKGGFDDPTLKDNNNTPSMVAMIWSIIDIVIHIILIIIAFIRKGKSNNTLNEELNMLLGIKKKDSRNIYNLDAISGHYVGTIFVFMGININALMIMNRIWAFDKNTAGGSDSDYLSGLILFGSNTLMLPSLGVMFGLTMVQFYTIKDDVVIEMFKYKDEKILKIQGNNIGKMLNELIYDKTLKSWVESLELKNRKGMNS